MLTKRLLLVSTLASTLVGLTVLLATSMAAGPPKPKVTNLSVVIEETLSVDNGATATTIRGDGAPYINGQEGVQAQFSSSGALFINFWPQPDLGVRSVFVDHAFPAPYPSPETVHPELIMVPPTTSVEVANPRLNSELAGSTQVPLQNLGIGGTQCLKFWWGNSGPVGTSAHGWVDNFHMNNADTADSVASFVVAKRTSQTTWTLESNKSSGVCPNLNQTLGQDAIAMVLHDETITIPGKRGGSSTTTYKVKDGYYSMPFRITLTALP